MVLTPGSRSHHGCYSPPRCQLSPLSLVSVAAVEEMSPLHTPVAFALPAGGEGWAADPSSGHSGEVSPEEPEEPRPVVSPCAAPHEPASLTHSGRGLGAAFPAQALWEGASREESCLSRGRVQTGLKVVGHGVACVQIKGSPGEPGHREWMTPREWTLQKR